MSISIKLNDDGRSATWSATVITGRLIKDKKTGLRRWTDRPLSPQPDVDRLTQDIGSRLRAALSF